MSAPRVQNARTGQERRLLGTSGRWLADASTQSPAILIVGNVLAAYRDRSAAAAPGDELRVLRRPGSGT